MTDSRISKELEHELRRGVRGEVRFDDGSRGAYSTDASNYRQIPIGVVVPLDQEDIIQTVAACRHFEAPVLARGGGTSLAGQCCNVAVVIDMSKYYNRILDIDWDGKRARVQPGLVLDDLHNVTEERHLIYAPDPATHNHCTFGGMIGNNSCGIHSLMAGKTAENIDELEILTYDGARMKVGATSEQKLEEITAVGGRRGEIYARLKSIRDRYADQIRERYPDIPRRVSGYNLDELLPEKGFHVARALVGTEGTCAIVLEATVRLVHSPPCKRLVVLGYPDVYSAADHVPEILEADPLGLEGIDSKLVANIQRKGLQPEDLDLLPEGGGWLLVEIGGQDEDEAKERVMALIGRLEKAKSPPSIKHYDVEKEAERVWHIRESGLGATARAPGRPDTWEGWEDSAVPPAQLGDYLRDLRKLAQKYDYDTAIYGHFGQGCVHDRINFDLRTAQGLEQFRSFLDEASDLVLTYGGSLSGEHGDGQSRGWLLPKMFGEELVSAFREFKSAWDPDWKMNPGKVVDPDGVTEHLRLGTSYNPPRVSTHFQYPEDDGNFARAALRCVGVGKCRKKDSGTMCPSYMVTLEEEHSTRGRARLLFEMLQGDVIGKGWRDEAVKHALDLCLACKGCKSECPVSVDMATYKAEFYSHYYEHRLRPASAFSMGLIYWWARLASLMPHAANLISHAPVFSAGLKKLGGIAPQRDLPNFAPQTFTSWFHKRRSGTGRQNAEGAPRVLLWPDTFNNYFHPEVAKSAVEVLEAAGYQIELPRQSLCCGRPLYDYGMLDTAKSLLRRIIDALRPQLREGIPVIGMEPSCLAVFRDELLGLFPHDEDARRLKQQSFTLAEFLEKKADYRPPALPRKALVHAHCHHSAIMGFDSEKELLSRLNLNHKLLDSGCCGMAGSFGFEEEKYEVSVKCGERVLLPSVRKAEKDCIIIADGFSCREQIAQLTDRRALHLAQVLQMALHQKEHSPGEAYPERQMLERRRAVGSAGGRSLTVAALFGAGLLAGIFLLQQRRKKHEFETNPRRPREDLRSYL